MASVVVDEAGLIVVAGTVEYASTMLEELSRVDVIVVGVVIDA